MPYDLNLNFTRTRIVDPRLNVTRASKKTDAGGWDFTSGGTVGVLAEYASGVAAIHPTVGLLVEEGSTNEIRNPRCEGAVVGVVGSGGALPDNWSASMAGITPEVMGSGNEQGWRYVDIKFSGVPTASGFVYAETSTTLIAAVQGEQWSYSAGVSVVGGDLTNITELRFSLAERNSGGGYLTETFIAFTQAFRCFRGCGKCKHRISAPWNVSYL